MRIINKKYLLILIFSVVILTGVIVFKSKENIKLDNEISKQKINNKIFVMYTETDSGYEEYKENKFPEGYVLNLNESKCLDNNGKEVDNILSYKNGEVTVTSGKTTYCYLYFDKSLGLEIKETNPHGLSICEYDAKTKYEQCGGMHRFQGQQADGIENYICFGTSDEELCKKDQSHYMYRIIGIEASTGRVKVIKKEALEKAYQWFTNYHDNIKLPESNFFKAINGQDFLTNNEYVPEGWEEKITNNTWLYGDMLENEFGAMQMGEKLYEIESGKKSTKWYVKSTLEDGGTPSAVQWDSNNKYSKGTLLYYKEEFGNWIDTIESKVSLMYLNDYSYSIGDEAKCDYYYGEAEYSKCKTGWIHLSQNDLSAPNEHEWMMSSLGWSHWSAAFYGFRIDGKGATLSSILVTISSVRPVFFINASEELLSGTGTITDPFIIK